MKDIPLKYLSFSHIRGFNDLCDTDKDTFISLYKDHIKRLKASKHDMYSETNIQRIIIKSNNDFQVFFKHGTQVIYNAHRKFEKGSNNKGMDLALYSLNSTYKKD